MRIENADHLVGAVLTGIGVTVLVVIVLALAGAAVYDLVTSRRR